LVDQDTQLDIFKYTFI